MFIYIFALQNTDVYIYINISILQNKYVNISILQNKYHFCKIPSVPEYFVLGVT